MRGLKLWFRAWLIALDQLAYVTLDFPAAARGHPTPSPCETISSKCGRMALAGHRWAVRAAAAIDWLAERLGAEPGHCQRAIVRADMLSFY